MGASRVPRVCYIVGDAGRLNVFWTVRILEREKEEREWWGTDQRRARINLDHLRIADGYRHVVLTRHSKTSRSWDMLESTKVEGK